MECTTEGNLKGCTCTYLACPLRGKCCACVTKHRRVGEVPGCLFTKAGEALWDRSFAAFCKDRGTA
ncbi:MAG: hypothetical protein IPN59_17370 [Holophaga sp.]|nr:hypothetical protein [Holophaga sp.]